MSIVEYKTKTKKYLQTTINRPRDIDIFGNLFIVSLLSEFASYIEWKRVKSRICPINQGHR